MKFIDGKKIADELVEKLRSNFSAINKERLENNLNKVSLGVFVVGDDPVINSFVRIKNKIAEKVDIDFKLFNYDKDISEKDFINSFLKEQKKVDGVIIQLPLSEKIDREKILALIDEKKDVDMLNPNNIDKNKNTFIFKADKLFAPVSGAIFKIINSVEYNLKNKKIVVIGKGKLTGQPFIDDLINLGFQNNKDFFVIDTKISDELKKDLIKDADLIVSGVGIPNLIKKEDIKENVFLIDAGTSTMNKKLEGDISLDCIEQAKYFSKTPGGVGPLTVVVLYENLLKLVS